MKKTIKRIALAVICLCVLPFPTYAAQMLTPVGQVVGLELRNGSVSVASIDEVVGENCKKAGIQPGDVLMHIDKTEIHTADDVRKALEHSDGIVTMEVSRNGKAHTLRVKPVITGDGPKLGLYLRQGVTGIGTVTWYDAQSGDFGTLGHGVNGSDGKILSMTQGNAYAARVVTVRKGKAGDPGQLMGAVSKLDPIGALTQNTPQGVFGKTQDGWQGQQLPVAELEEIKTGSATILSTVSGEETREYSVEILKIYPKSRENGRNLLLKVTDPALLETTGGIVQGMSGSPIIQDGRLIGAVTHVLVNDPTTGYGIFIENMLDAAA